MTIKVQSGTVTGLDGSVEVTVEEYDPDHTFAVVFGRGDDSTGSPVADWAVRVNTNIGSNPTTTISVQNLGDDGEGYAEWFLVEALDDEFTVQKYQGTIDATGDGLTRSVTLDSVVTLSRTQVFVSSRLAGSATDPRDDAAASYVRAYLSDSSTLEVERADIENAWTAWVAYVVEWSVASGVTVESGENFAFFDSTTSTITLSETKTQDLNFLYVSQAHNRVALEGVAARWRLAGGAGELLYDRFNTVNSSLSAWAWFVTKFPSGSAFTTQGGAVAGTTDASLVVTLDQAVKADRSLIAFTNSCDGEGQAFPKHLWTPEFTSIDGDGMADEVTLTRDYTGQAGRAWVNVVDFSGFNNPRGSAAVTLPALESSSTGSQTVEGSAAVTLPALTSSATGLQTIQAVGIRSLPALESASTGTQTVEGSAAVILPALESASTGTQTVEGSAAVTLPALESASTGTQTVEGSAAVILPALESASTGTQTVEGSAAVTLPALESASTGTQTVEGSAAVILPALESASTGTVAAGDVEGSAALTLPSLESASTGTVEAADADGSAALILPALESASTGVQTVEGSAVLALPALQVAVVGDVEPLTQAPDLKASYDDVGIRAATTLSAPAWSVATVAAPLQAAVHASPPEWTVVSASLPAYTVTHRVVPF